MRLLAKFLSNPLSVSYRIGYLADFRVARYTLFTVTSHFRETAVSACLSVEAFSSFADNAGIRKKEADGAAAWRSGVQNAHAASECSQATQDE